MAHVGSEIVMPVCAINSIAHCKVHRIGYIGANNHAAAHFSGIVLHIKYDIDR
jgi:hypothetical protein